MSLSSLLAVLSFYICSCTCLQPSPDSSAPKHAVKASASMWREEIENYPQRDGSSLTPYSTHPPSTPVTSSSSSAEHHYHLHAHHYGPGSAAPMVMPLDFTAASTLAPLLRTQPAPARIHPPVNDHHPPVVSVADRETRWMTLPPPSAREIHSLNRHINRTRDRSLHSSIGSSIASPFPDPFLSAPPLPQQQQQQQQQQLPPPPPLLQSPPATAGRPMPTVPTVPLAIENMVVSHQQREQPRERFREGVLDDMDAPLRPGVIRGNTAPARLRLGRRSTKCSARSGRSEEAARRNDRALRGLPASDIAQLASP